MGRYHRRIRGNYSLIRKRKSIILDLIFHLIFLSCTELENTVSELNKNLNGNNFSYKIIINITIDLFCIHQKKNPLLLNQTKNLLKCRVQLNVSRKKQNGPCSRERRKRLRKKVVFFDRRSETKRERN